MAAQNPPRGQRWRFSFLRDGGTSTPGHQPQEAADLIEQLSRRDSADTTVQLLRIESLILDKKDGTGALSALAGLHIPPDNRRLQIRVGLLRADAWVAVGRTDSAKATLTALVQSFPDVPRIKEKLDQLH